MIRNRSNVTFLKSTRELPFVDHSFSSPTYKKPIQDEIERFKENLPK